MTTHSPLPVSLSFILNPDGSIIECCLNGTGWKIIYAPTWTSMHAVPSQKGVKISVTTRTSCFHLIRAGTDKWSHLTLEWRLIAPFPTEDKSQILVVGLREHIARNVVLCKGWVLQGGNCQNWATCQWTTVAMTKGKGLKSPLCQ